MKKVNINEETPLKRTEDSREKLTKEELYVEENIIVGNSGVLGFMLFSLQKISSSYNVSYDDVLIFLYLKELWVFPLQIVILNRTIRLGEYLKDGYIAVDYSNNNKELYKLTEKSNKILRVLYELLNNTDGFIMDNRKTDVDLTRRLNAVLEKLF